ncbi:MAG: hypothetical protein ABI680_15275, partial [Chthoniobacteraceae bacterium]
VRAAALLPEKREIEIDPKPDAKPYWHLERARLGDSREVTVEAVVNGRAVAAQKMVADGSIRDLQFDLPIEQSSWVALRIFPSSHTNPVFIEVDGQPIRPSRRSIDWCLRSVDQCWSQKERFIAPAEMEEARAAYDHARQIFRQRLAEAKAE